MKKIFLIISLMLFCSSIFAEPVANVDPATATTNLQNQIYKVEVIIFKYNDAVNNTNINWQTSPAPANFSNAMGLLAYTPPEQDQQDTDLAPNLYQLLPDNEFDLSSVVHRIDRSNRYQMLVQAAWYMPLNATKSIRITGGEEFANTGTYELDGIITLNQNNYINVKTNFSLTEEINGELQTATMHESRRMKPKQLSYLDSPTLGILIKIVPLNTSASQDQKS